MIAAMSKRFLTTFLLSITYTLVLWSQVGTMAGKGYSGNPYQVTSAADLQAIASTINAGNQQTAEFIQMNDIDMSTVANFTSIGSDSQSFNGVYDGNGFEISNLTVSVSGNNGGMFGVAEDATIKNLRLENADINVEGDNAGAVLAFGKNRCAIINCHSSGKVKAKNNAGGLVGFNQVSDFYIGEANPASAASFIIKSSSSSSVFSETNTGGIAGVAHGSVKDCFFTGYISGLDNTGGIAGKAIKVVKYEKDINASSNFEYNYVSGHIDHDKTYGAIVGGIDTTAAVGDNVVMQGRVFEKSFVSDSTYNNPFTEVEVDVVFSKDDKQWKQAAFWRGGNEWSVRFAFPGSGTFTYSVESNDETLNNIGGIIDVEEYKGGNRLLQRGHLKISDNKRYFEHSDGTPFLWLGDTWWKCLSYRLPWQDFQTLVDDRSKKGFSAVQIVAGLNPEEPAFDKRGENEGGWVWEENYEKINPEYFDFMDRRIQYLIDSELVPCIVGCWGGYMTELGKEKMKLHWRNLVARYGAYPVVWIVAGEWVLPIDCGDITDYQKNGWIELIEYVKSIDPYQSPATLHEGVHRRTSTTRDWVTDQSLVDFDLLQTGHGEDTYFKKTVSNISHCYSMTPAKPVICGEVAYEGHTDRPPNIYKNHDELSPFPQRYLFWTSMLQGAAGHTYGANGIWQVESPEYPHGWSETCTNNNFWLTPWYTAKDFFGSISLPLGKKLLERYEWWRFEPHQDWVNPAGTSLTDAHSTWTNPLTIWNNLNGNCMLPYAAGIANEVRVIYIPFGATAPQVKKIETSVDYKAFYLNPADGTEYDLGAVAPISGNWQAPVLPTTSSDWILVLEKEN